MNTSKIQKKKNITMMIEVDYIERHSKFEQHKIEQTM